jgi:hypothetical protein
MKKLVFLLLVVMMVVSATNAAADYISAYARSDAQHPTEISYDSDWGAFDPDNEPWDVTYSI